MRTISNAKPLITNFIVPEAPKAASVNLSIIYDRVNQVSYCMGGGSGPTRSYDGYRATREKRSGGYYEHNDAERWTDD